MHDNLKLPARPSLDTLLRDSARRYRQQRYRDTALFIGLLVLGISFLLWVVSPQGQQVLGWIDEVGK